MVKVRGPRHSETPRAEKPRAFRLGRHALANAVESYAENHGFLMPAPLKEVAASWALHTV